MAETKVSTGAFSAHDVCNELQKIILHAELLEMRLDPSDDKNKFRIDVIISAAQKAAELVRRKAG